jgi:hypothetical protein
MHSESAFPSMSDFAGITRMGDRQRLAVFGGRHDDDETPQNTSTRLAARFSLLTNAAVQALNALAADRALAQQAATMAALPGQRLSELRALYMTHERVLARVAVDKGNRPRAFESSEFLSADEEKRAA